MDTKKFKTMKMWNEDSADENIEQPLLYMHFYVVKRLEQKNR